MKDIGHLCAHYERSVRNDNYSNLDIDKSKLDLDRVNLAPDRGKQTDYIKEKIKEIMGERTLRKDAVRMCCWIVDAPAEMPEEKRPVFFDAVYQFLVNRYGKKSGMGDDVVISAYIHKSETTEHLHFAFLPVLQRKNEEGELEKTFCAKEVISREDLKTFHEDLAKHLESLNICKKADILNGATKKDSSGRAYSVKELKMQRGKERTRWEGTRTQERSWTR